ncbi:unnamed protein product [Owenia fusiformis]|uniref:Uncharacterized protein n=1 Tax=Owenia fusiformis TaxID=6347 RepID=A0A8J1T5T1_OWEFU|nr:unnamed protein product [Owenia fusiformis]
MLVRSLLHVSITLIIIILLSFSGLFDSVQTELGLEHYAERPSLFLPFMSKEWIVWLKLPANATVNIGYTIIGLYWLFYTNRNYSGHTIHIYYFKVFGWFGVFYGFIQFARIVTQEHRYSVLDQWVTLPCFMWVTAWCKSIDQVHNPSRNALLICISAASYGACLFHKFGFEFILGMHIAAAVLSALRLYSDYNNIKSFNAFIYAVICTSGFVGLKLMDHEIGKLHIFFQYFSGHFWSKIADFMQLYYVPVFFAGIIETKLKINKSL